MHHGFIYTFQEGLDALPDVIRHIETYDVTTIRASTPMYLMARRIKAMGVKMVLSGEGSDEIFGGYLYFHKAPNAREFHEETVRKLDALHHYDCLRANKSMAAWGVEARVPFLDVEFLDVAMRMDAQHKMVGAGRRQRIEKAILREAFAGYLPDEILWRQKEQFSDGVGYGWIDGLKAHAQAQVSDREFAAAASASRSTRRRPRRRTCTAASSSSSSRARPARRRCRAASRSRARRRRRSRGTRRSRTRPIRRGARWRACTRRRWGRLVLPRACLSPFGRRGGRCASLQRRLFPLPPREGREPQRRISR